MFGFVAAVVKVMALFVTNGILTLLVLLAMATEVMSVPNPDMEYSPETGIVVLSASPEFMGFLMFAVGSMVEYMDASKMRLSNELRYELRAFGEKAAQIGMRYDI